jgi:hypothetical protein
MSIDSTLQGHTTGAFCFQLRDAITLEIRFCSNLRGTLPEGNELWHRCTKHTTTEPWVMGYFEKSHCEERSDEAISIKHEDCFGKKRLAMTFDPK